MLEEAERRRVVESLHIRSSAVGAMPIIQEQKFENLQSVLTKMTAVQFPWISQDPEDSPSQAEISPEIQNLIDNFDEIVHAVTGKPLKDTE